MSEVERNRAGPPEYRRAHVRRRPKRGRAQARVGQESVVEQGTPAARSQEPGARSQEPGARSQEPGARSRENTEEGGKTGGRSSIVVDRNKTLRDEIRRARVTYSPLTTRRRRWARRAAPAHRPRGYSTAAPSCAGIKPSRIPSGTRRRGAPTR